MDQLPDDAKDKRIDIRQFFVSDESSSAEGAIIPRLSDQPIFVEEKSASATSAIISMAEGEVQEIIGETRKRKTDDNPGSEKN